MKKNYPTVGRASLVLMVAFLLFSNLLSATIPFAPGAWHAAITSQQSLQPRRLGSIPFLAEMLMAHQARQVQQVAPNAVCFDVFTAGDDASYCAGDTAILKGGYDAYVGSGSEILFWTVMSGTGTLSYSGAGFPQGGSSINSPNGNFSTMNPPRYIPGPGETSAILELRTFSNDNNCEIQTDQVTLFFDPFPQPEIAYSLAGMPADTIVPLETSVDTICPGTEVGLSILNAATIPNSQQFGYTVFYEVTVSNAGNLAAVPGTGVYYLSAAGFATNFASLTFNNTTGATQHYVVSMKAYYETDPMNPGLASGLCLGDAAVFDFAVLNTPQATSGIEGVIPGNPNICEGEDALIRITGTTFTTVTYRVDTMAGGALLMGADSTIHIDASGIADVFLPTDNLAGDSLIFNLLSIRYQTAAACARALNEQETVIVLNRPDASLGLVFLADTVRCNGDFSSIQARLFTDAPGMYSINYQVYNTRGISSMATASVNATNFLGINSGDFTVSPTASHPLGDTIFIKLVDITRTDIMPNCVATINDSIFVIEEAESFASFEVKVSGQDFMIVSPNNTPVVFNVCDETDLSILLDSLNESVAGLPTRMRLRVLEDEYNLLGLGTVLDGGTEIVVDTTIAGFSIDTFLDVPNNLTVSTSIILIIRPYFDLDGVAGLTQANDCASSNGFRIRINILPSPIANIMVENMADTTVCVGETINLRITGPENGSVTLATGIAGAAQTIALDATGVALVPKTITESTLFTLTSVSTMAPPACMSIINRQLIINTESRPMASIMLVEDTICYEASTMLAVSFTGNAPAYSFTIDSAGTAVSYTATADTLLPISEATVGGIFTLMNVANAGTTRNCPWLAPTILPADMLVVELDLVATVNINFTAAGLQSIDGTANPTDTIIVCSGESTEFASTSVGILGADPSVQTGLPVYFRIEVSDPLGAFPGFSADQFIQFTGGGISGILAGQTINNTLAVSADVVITFTPFFFDNSNGAPSSADFAQACKGDPITSTIRVNPLPRITFGGNTTICEGDSTILTFTGFPNGSITITSTSPSPGYPMGFNDGDIVTLNNTGVGTLKVGPLMNATYTVGNITDGTPQMCVNTTTLDVNVEVVPTPDVTVSATNSAVCSGATTTFALNGGPAGAVVYYHIDTASTFGTLIATTVTLDGTGSATVTTPSLPEDMLVYIDSIDTQSPIVCRNILGYDFLIVVNSPPAGTLSSNGPVCTGEAVQLTYVDALADPTDSYTLIVNGTTYSGITTGTAFQAADTTTSYVLNAITQEFGQMCSDTITAGVDTLEVVIEAVPAATLSGTLGGLPATADASTPFVDTVCSGTAFALATMGMPATSSIGDPLFYEIMLSDTASVLSLGSGSVLVPAAAANALLSGIGNMLTYTGSGDLALVRVAVLPYYESNPSGPDGPLTASACPGDTVFVDVYVRQQLTFPTLTPDMATICQDSSVILNFAGGTPNTRVTFFYNGLTDIVDLDGNGKGQSQPITLITTTNFFVTGISTLSPAAPCTRLRTPSAPVSPFDITVTVVPTPFVTTFAFQQDTVCHGNVFTVNIVGTPNATVYYDIPDVMSGTVVTNGAGVASFTTAADAPDFTAETVTITLDSIVSNTMPSCPKPIGQSITGLVKPLPKGTITANGPACAGGSVDLIFNALTSPVQDSFRIRVFGPSGSLGLSVVADGGVAYTVTEPGIYYLERIRDHFGNGSNLGVSCLNATAGSPSENLGTALVIIELEPQLGATAIGTSGVIALNNQSFINIFATAVCSGDDLVVPFNTTTAASQAADPFTNPLYVQVSFNDPGEILPSILPAAAGQTSPFVIPFTDLDFNGVLDNNTNANLPLNVTLTPYFEDSTSVTSLEMGECAGRTLQFNITVLPQLNVVVDATNSTSTVCADGTIMVALSGSAGASVYFSANNITLSTPSPVVLDGNGEFTIIGEPVSPSTTTNIILDSIELVSTVMGQNRLCRYDLSEQFDITVNPLPTGNLALAPADPICNGDSATLLFQTHHGDGDYSLVVNGQTYDVTVDQGEGEVLAQAFTETSFFTLTSITDFNGCVGITSNTTTLQVEEIPAAEIEINAPAAAPLVILEAGDIDTFTICTGSSVAVDAAFLTTPLNGARWYQIEVSGDADFFGLGGANTTTALAAGDLDPTLSVALFNLGNTPLSTTLVITPYIEKNTNGMLDLDECSGEPITITFTVNPNPVTEAITSAACSDEEHTVDLMSAVTNGVTGVDFTYTVMSSNPAAVPAPANCTSGCNPLTASFTNTSNNAVVITYTVTPRLNGCRGNDFMLTDTIHPEPVLAPTMNSPICGDETTGITLGTSNTLAGMTSYELAGISFSTTSTDFSADAANASLGSIGDANILEDDVYYNLSPETVTVTYSIVPISARGCKGDTAQVSIDIYPEPKVANLVIEICSGARLDFDIIQDLVENQVGSNAFFIRRKLVGTTLIVLDENNNQECSTNNNCSGLFGLSSFGQDFIGDSIINTGTATQSIFYDIVVQDDNGCGDDGALVRDNGLVGTTTFFGNVFTLEVRVREEADVDINAASTDFCTGDPITLSAVFSNGSATPTYIWSVDSQDATVTAISLTPNGTGSAVTVDGSGFGAAVIRVIASDLAGCVATNTIEITLGETPAAQNIQGFATPCLNSFVSPYSLALTAGNTYTWSLSNPIAGSFVGGISSGVGLNGVIIDWNLAGPVTLTCVETSPSGCSRTHSLALEVVQESSANFSFTVDQGNNLLVNFTENAQGDILGYDWNFGDGVGTSTMANPSYEYAAAGTYNVRLITASLCGGSLVQDTIIRSVTVGVMVVCQDLVLSTGNNFVSLFVDPFDTDLQNNFGSFSEITQIITFDAGARLFLPGGGGFNSLTNFTRGFGYLISASAPVTVQICGTPEDGTYRRPLDTGTNFVGSTDPSDIPATDFFATLEATGDLNVAYTLSGGGFETYFPGGGPFNSLTTVSAGVGYVVVTNNAVGANSYRENPGGEANEFVYGVVSGLDLRADNRVEVINQEGLVIAQLEVQEDGTYAATAISGEMARVDGSFVEGLQADEAYSFRYRGKTIDAGLTYQGGNRAQRIDLDFSEELPTEPVVNMALAVSPNPMVDQARVVLKVEEADNYELSVMDVNGRQIATIFNGRIEQAGQYDFTWQAAALPSGVYTVMLRKGRELIPELSQRVIK